MSDRDHLLRKFSMPVGTARRLPDGLAAGRTVGRPAGDAGATTPLLPAHSIFEPVVMVCNPGQAEAVGRMCGPGTTPVEIPINDSWCRDSGPAFVRNDAGEWP
jgi:hypothetical protein